MKNNIGILHLSDIHMCEKEKGKISTLVEKLKEDITNLKSKHNFDIKIICVSGDLINSGDNSEEELQLWFDLFLQPILSFLKLDEKSVYIVPGNHEVKREKISPYSEKGLSDKLITEKAIEEFLASPEINCIERIRYFNDDFSSMFGSNMKISNSLYSSYVVEFDNFKIGIACINSAWRSTGIGSAEKRKMIIGRKQLTDTYETIKDANLKICLVHHPFDWLVDDDKTSIEKCINNFDVVLTGHIHESDTRFCVTSNGQTLFNTCGKFDNTSDIYNGYSILSINPMNLDCEVYLRQYFDYPRNAFDKALCVSDDGVFSMSLSKKDDSLVTAYNIAVSIKDAFTQFSNEFFVSNSSYKNSEQSLEESFIIPQLSRKSEYEKETRFDLEKNKHEEEINLSDLCKSEKNIVLFGNEEVGKTTILHYLSKQLLCNFNTFKKVPIVLGIQQIDFAGKQVIERAICKFINEYCDETHSFNKNEVSKLLELGLFTIMFDDFDSVNAKQLSIINGFIKNNPNNRFIFSETNHISSKPLHKPEIVPECDYEIVHVCSLSKHQIRSIAKKKLTDENSSTLVDKVMLCFKNTALPKTPFIVSLILSLCTTKDFSPINEAVLMEMFLERLLEKASESEVYSNNFDFRDKEDFLMFIVEYMNKENKFYLSFAEFDTLVYQYHQKIGYSVSETHFDTLFFEKGVLLKTYDTVCFKYNCFAEYYIAKRANDSVEFLNHILENRNYLNYPKELLYYTGLNRKKGEVASIIEKDLQKDFGRLFYLIEELDNYNIGINVAMPDDEFIENITGEKLSEIEIDDLQDVNSDPEQNNPKKIDKNITHEEMDSFARTLMIYGNCLKTLDHLDFAEKKKMYHNYLNGLCIMLGIFIRRTEEFYYEEFNDVEQLPEDCDEKELESFVKDIIKISLPLMLENIALENIGTTKLKKIIEDVVNDSPNSFSKFFSVFLYCDLRIPGLRDVLKSYCAESNDKSLLTIIFFKLLYYYRFGYFSKSLNQFLENTLMDINSKLYNCSKVESNVVIGKLKSQKRLEKGKF